jgi:imidazolonepropionase-like amidohydrolase
MRQDSSVEKRRDSKPSQQMRHIRAKYQVDVMKQLLVFAMCLVTAFAVAAQNRSEVTAITNVTIVDVTGKPSKPGMTVVITGPAISAIGKTGRIKIPKGANVINGEDKFLIPGLWDMHVHIFNNVSKRSPNEYYFPLFIANGVTSVRDMWTKPEAMSQVRAWRKQVNDKPGTIPRLAAVGTLVDGDPVSWPNADSVLSAEEARQFVRRIKASGIDFVKVYNNLSREAYFAIADEAKKQNIPFAGHVPSAIVVSEIADAGQRSVEHLTGSTKDCTTFVPLMQKELVDARAKNSTEVPLIEAALDTCDPEKAFAMYKRFARRGIRQVPTFPIMIRTSREVEKVLLDDRLKYVPDADAAGWEGFAARLRDRKPEQVERGKAYLVRALRVVRDMHRAGISFMAGTDVGNEFIYPGSSLHDDLETFVEAGFTPLEALQTATVNPAAFLGMSGSIGTIEKGKLADLVLLDADPLTDITNTRKIHAVVANGRYLSRTQLDQMLTDATSEAKGK